MKKLFITLLVVGACVPAWAWIEDKPAGSNFHPEQSQGQVEAQQGLNGTYGEVGSTPTVLGAENVESEAAQQDAANALGAADKQRVEKANDAIKKTDNKKQESNWLRTMLLAVAAIGVVGGVFVWLKKFSDNGMPPMPKNGRSGF